MVETLGRVQTPVLALAGGADALSPRDLIDEARRRAPGSEWVVYRNAGARFFDESAGEYDREAAEDLIRRTGQQGVPVIVAGREAIVGFARGRLESVLSRAVPPRTGLGAKVAAAETIGRKRRVALPPGAFVGRVKPGSPAEKVDLREGDVILALGGTVVNGPSAVEEALAALPRGVPAEIVWWCEGRTHQGQARFDWTPHGKMLLGRQFIPVLTRPEGGSPDR